MKDSKNIVIGMLCAVVCIMAVAYAAFSTSLTVTTTATVASNWCVKIKTASCPTKTPATGGAANSVTAGVETATDALSATVSMSFTQPGDTASCIVTYENCGSLNALVTNTVQGKVGAGEFSALNIDDTGVATLTTAANGIKFTVSGLSQKTLNKDGATMDITITGEYLNVAAGQESPEITSAQVKISSLAEQAI